MDFAKLFLSILLIVFLTIFSTQIVVFIELFEVAARISTSVSQEPYHQPI